MTCASPGPPVNPHRTDSGSMLVAGTAALPTMEMGTVPWLFWLMTVPASPGETSTITTVGIEQSTKAASRWNLPGCASYAAIVPPEAGVSLPSPLLGWLFPARVTRAALANPVLKRLGRYLKIVTATAGVDT